MPMEAGRSNATQGDGHSGGEKWHPGGILKVGANGFACQGLLGSQRKEKLAGQL